MKDLIQSIFEQVRAEVEKENDVENLMDVEVTYTCSQLDVNKLLVTVAAIADGVGITIVEAANKKNEIVCLNGPLSKHETYKYFDAFFEATVSMIKEGHIDMDVVYEKIGQRAGGGGAIAACAFGIK